MELLLWAVSGLIKFTLGDLSSTKILIGTELDLLASSIAFIVKAQYFSIFWHPNVVKGVDRVNVPPVDRVPLIELPFSLTLDNCFIEFGLAYTEKLTEDEGLFVCETLEVAVFIVGTVEISVPVT